MHDAEVIEAHRFFELFTSVQLLSEHCFQNFFFWEFSHAEQAIIPIIEKSLQLISL